MTGEMSREDVTPEEFPLHFAIAKAMRGKVHPFDVYQGPYVAARKGKFWISAHLESCDHGHEHDTGLVEVFNEATNKTAVSFPEPESVVAAARETCN